MTTKDDWKAAVVAGTTTLGFDQFTRQDKLARDKAKKKSKMICAGDTVRVKQSGDKLGETRWMVASVADDSFKCVIREITNTGLNAPQSFDTSLLQKVPLKKFPVEMSFLMSGNMRHSFLPAEDAADALMRAEACITTDRQFDPTMWAKMGGNSDTSWRTHAGTDHDYRVDESDIGDPQEIE